MSRILNSLILLMLLLSLCGNSKRPLDFSRAEYIGTWYQSLQVSREDESFMGSAKYTFLADSFYYRCDYLTNSFSDSVGDKKALLDSGEWELDDNVISLKGVSQEFIYVAEFATARDTLYFYGPKSSVKALLRSVPEHVSVD